jgi:hypothetical protein
VYVGAHKFTFFVQDCSLLLKWLPGFEETFCSCSFITAPLFLQAKRELNLNNKGMVRRRAAVAP